MVEKVSGYAIFLLDCDGTIQTWNPAAQAMKGYRTDEAVGRNFSMLYTDQERIDGRPEHNLREAAKHGTYQEEDWRQRKDCSRFWALIEIIAIKDASGNLTGFCKLTRDGTDRRKMEEALQDADRRKDEFLAMLAHELRNPLAPVSAAAELLSLQKLDAESSKKASQVIMRQVKHMTELVDDLLDVSRVSRGQVKLDIRALDMKIVVGAAIEQVRSLIEHRDHTLAIVAAPSKAHVKGDEKRLIQVVANLVNNAAKYTQPGGAIEVRLSVTGNDVCIVVSDNGVGIEQGAQHNIFEMFEQVQRTSDRTTGGLGIGLALVHNIVELHKGTVTCHSDGIGLGSRFTVCIPGLKVEDSGPERRRVERSLELPLANNKLSILIVDDNVDAAEMIEFFLVTAGHNVTLAHTAKAALTSLKTAVPDVCILDIGLPDLTGHDLALQIRTLHVPAPVLIEPLAKLAERMKIAWQRKRKGGGGRPFLA
ncbi:PAS domain-containing hybrid sensor histidine kinase/response regulator [Massilia frigida]|nr:ATP-binding protein [Massilia frigida]